MKIVGTPSINLNVSRTPKSDKLKSLQSECNYLFLLGAIGLESLGFCEIEIAVPTTNWWNIQECPVDYAFECGEP